MKFFLEEVEMSTQVMHYEALTLESNVDSRTINYWLHNLVASGDAVSVLL